MKKETLKQVAEFIFAERKRCIDINEAFYKYCEAIAPGQHPIFHEDDSCSRCVELLRITEREIADDLEYFVYEAMVLEKSENIKIVGKIKEYVIHNKEDAIEYLLSEYGE